MKKPQKIMTKAEFDNQRGNNTARKAKEFKEGRTEFDTNSKQRQKHSDSAKKGIETLSGIDSKYSQVIDLLGWKIKAAKENRDKIRQQASTLMDSEIIDDMDRAAIQSENDIDKLSAQKANIADKVKALDNELDDLLVRYGSGTGNLGKNSSSQSSIAAIGSKSNTYDPSIPGAEEAAFDRALWGSAAAKLGVNPSIMKEL